MSYCQGCADRDRKIAELEKQVERLADARGAYDVLFERSKGLERQLAEQARELSLCREWRDAVQGIAVDAGVVITGDPIEDVRLAIEFRDTAIAEQAEEIERLRKEEGGEE